jgi:hypothetical protein
MVENVVSGKAFQFKVLPRLQFCGKIWVIYIRQEFECALLSLSCACRLSYSAAQSLGVGC